MDLKGYDKIKYCGRLDLQHIKIFKILSPSNKIILNTFYCVHHICFSNKNRKNPYNEVNSFNRPLKNESSL